MKKIICIIVILLCSICLVSCSASDDNAVLVDPNAQIEQKQDNTAQEVKAPDESASAEENMLYFETNGSKIYVYDISEDVLGRLGEPNGTFEAASCAYQGMDYFYYYDGFELTVNKVDDAEHVTIIMIVDDTVSIPQGVKIGSTKETMLSCMGDDYKEEAGIFKFITGYTTLQIQIKDGCVASMMYIYTPQQ